MGAQTQIQEDLLQFIWKLKFFSSQTALKSTEGQAIEIIQAGNYNHNQGPDFLLAKVKIDEITWVGNIEIHVRTSHWLQHRHQDDPAYQNVILHVVYENDLATKHPKLPKHCLELKNYISPELLENYRKLKSASQGIACSGSINSVDKIYISDQLERMLAERWQQKVRRMQLDLKEHLQDWEELLYKKISQYLVTPVNVDAMNILSSLVPRKLLLKQSGHLFQMEALLLGAAGFLETEEDAGSYLLELKSEYQFLRQKFDLQSMNPSEWKFLRMRPAHFPTIRIAQIAALICHHPQLFSEILQAKSLEELRLLFKNSVSDFWKHHFSFKKKGTDHAHEQIGKNTIEILLINAVFPLIYCYGFYNSKEELCDLAMEWARGLKAESNKFTNEFTDYGFTINSSADSQAVIQLKTNYCNSKKCLQCSIGTQLMKKSHI
ncbi:MAG TPA: DUF2851 family protein [Saprospiraceae bacterium]|nr:DUF2851 family protein [Saprospiraceae bacterium]